jgi:hypothetical protein
MDVAHRKEVKYVAAGYAIYALMYIALAAILLSASGGFHNLDIIGGALSLIAGACLLNLLFAVGSWRVLTLSIWKRRLLLGGAISVAVVLVVSNLLGLWRWYHETLPTDIGPPAVMGGTLVALGYVFLAYGLMRIVATSNTSFNPDARKRRAG